MYKPSTLLIIGIIGLMVPFIPGLLLIQVFFLMVPYVIIFCITLVYLLISLFSKNHDKRKAFFIFLFLPTFILSQYLSEQTNEQIQKFRSEKLIEEAEQYKIETGEYPATLNDGFGIEYTRLNVHERFIITYSGGFLVTVKYDSHDQQWIRYGWND